MKNDREAGWIRCHFSAKAKRNVRNQQAHSVLLLGRFQRRATPPLALGHPIGARSIPVGGGIQRGRRSLWPEESKETSGFVAGNPTGTASPWHTTLLAKYSVLYLHPRLTGKRSVSTKERSFCSAGKRAGFCKWERAKT